MSDLYARREKSRSSETNRRFNQKRNFRAIYSIHSLFIVDGCLLLTLFNMYNLYRSSGGIRVNVN